MGEILLSGYYRSKEIPLVFTMVFVDNLISSIEFPQDEHIKLCKTAARNPNSHRLDVLTTKRGEFALLMFAVLREMNYEAPKHPKQIKQILDGETFKKMDGENRKNLGAEADYDFSAYDDYLLYFMNYLEFYSKMPASKFSRKVTRPSRDPQLTKNKIHEFFKNVILGSFSNYYSQRELTNDEERAMLYFSMVPEAMDMLAENLLLAPITTEKLVEFYKFQKDYNFEWAKAMVQW